MHRKAPWGCKESIRWLGHLIAHLDTLPTWSFLGPTLCCEQQAACGSPGNASLISQATLVADCKTPWFGGCRGGWEAEGQVL